MSIRRIVPEPGQESVWEYPRPPRCESSGKLIKIIVDGITIAESKNTQRILETSHPPVYYIPREDISMEWLVANSGTSWCEWKGTARYYDIYVGLRVIKNAAWGYPEPVKDFDGIRDHIAFYPSRMDACFVDDEPVRAQSGDFYGGWITHDIVGPFKGDPGTSRW